MTADIPTVNLLGDAMVPLVRAAGALEADDLPPFAIIGGVAGAVRLGRVLRATADLRLLGASAKARWANGRSRCWSAQPIHRMTSERGSPAVAGSTR